MSKKMTDQELFDAIMSIENEHCPECGKALYLLPDWPKDKRHDCSLEDEEEVLRTLKQGPR